MPFKWTEALSALRIKELNNMPDHKKEDQFRVLRKELPKKFKDLIKKGSLPKSAGFFSRAADWKDLVNMPDDNEHTLLIYAAKQDSHFLIRFLIKHGAEVNYQAAGKTTALHEACKTGSGNAVEELLIHASADSSLLDVNRMTAEDIHKQLSSNKTFLKKSHFISVVETEKHFFASSGPSYDEVNSKEYISGLFVRYKSSLEMAETILERAAVAKKSG